MLLFKTGFGHVVECTETEGDIVLGCETLTVDGFASVVDAFVTNVTTAEAVD